MAEVVNWKVADEEDHVAAASAGRFCAAAVDFAQSASSVCIGKRSGIPAESVTPRRASMKPSIASKRADLSHLNQRPASLSLS